MVAGAVILDPCQPIFGLDDSKKLTHTQREELYAEITGKALAWSVVRVEADECDQGIQIANLAALRRAVFRLSVSPDFVITDGFPVDGLGAPSLAMWKGDQIAQCVSAASIIAKVTRDRIMVEYHSTWPEYQFDKHKGYSTAVHQQALDRFGPCPIHRLSYGNVQRAARVGSL